jgi:vitamin B12 transporter
MRTRRPQPGEPMQAHLSAEAGGFSFGRYRAGTSGQQGALDWNASLLRMDTDNEGVNAGFEETAGALSVGAQLAPSVTLRGLARIADSRTDTPGQTLFGRHDDSYFDRTDKLFGLRLLATPGRAAHELRVAVARTDQVSIDPTDSGSFVARFGDRVASFESFDFPNPQGYQNDSQRVVAGYKVELQPHSDHLLTAGADLERETGELGNRGTATPMVSPSRTNFGVYVQDRWALSPVLFLTAGGRVERNDSFGTTVVPRAALSWRAWSRDGASTRLTASAGAGVKEPGFLESFDKSDFADGNPDLEPERSRTVDLGIEQRAFGDRLRVAVTGFRHDYRDQIAFQFNLETFRGTWINLGETRAQGIELEVEGAPRAGVRLFAQYTWLDSEIVVSSSVGDTFNAVGAPLLRRPRHSASLGASWKTADERLSAGATWVVVGARRDSDFAGLGLEENEGYQRLDARARVRLHRHLDVFAIGENLADREYQEVLGYPALGRSLRVGVTLRAGR